MLYRLLETTATIPGGWFTTTVLLILLAIAVVVAIHVARRTMRTNRGGDYQLFEAAQLTAAQHRATAEGYAAEGNWSAAIRHRLRAVARQLEETGVLESGSRPHRQRAGPRRRRGVAASGRRIIPGGNGIQRCHLRRAARNPGRLPDDRRPRRPPAVTLAGRPHRRRASPRRSNHGRRSGDGDRRSASRQPRPGRRRGDGGHGAGLVLTLVVLAVIAGDRRLPDRTAARRPDGSGIDRTRRRPRAGDAAARRRRRRRRGQQHRRRRAGGTARHADPGGAEPVPDRHHAAGPAGERPRRSAAGGTDGANPRGTDCRACACRPPGSFDSNPNCTLREANRAGSVRFGLERHLSRPKTAGQ